MAVESPPETITVSVAADISEIRDKLDKAIELVEHVRDGLGLQGGGDPRPLLKTEWLQEENAMCLYVGAVKVADVTALTFFARTTWHLRYMLPTLRAWAANGQKFTRLSDAKQEADLRLSEFIQAMWSMRDAQPTA